MKQALDGFEKNNSFIYSQHDVQGKIHILLNTLNIIKRQNSLSEKFDMQDKTNGKVKRAKI